MKALHYVAFTLLVIGGLNWGLSALGWNVVELIFGSGVVASAIYILVGLAAILEVVTHKNLCRNCNPGGAASA